MNNSHPLRFPFKSRRNGEDVEISELPLPEVITVGMFRRAPIKANQILWAHNLTEVCAKLGPYDAAKLMSPDAVDYVATLAPLLEADDAPGFDVPKIRPVKALISKITASVNEPVEFAAQLLEHSGMKASEINAMDVRKFLPAVELVLSQMADPK